MSENKMDKLNIDGSWEFRERFSNVVDFNLTKDETDLLIGAIFNSNPDEQAFFRDKDKQLVKKMNYWDLYAIALTMRKSEPT